MDPYFAFFLAGCAGLCLMAFLGAAGNHGHHAGGHAARGAEGFHLHGTGGHGTHLHSDTRFHHTPAPHGVHQAAHHGLIHHANSHSVAGHGHASAGFKLREAVSGWLSPRVLFTLSMGSGAAGLCLEAYVSNGPLRALISLCGGIALEKLVVAPLWAVLMRFASSPARTLDSAVMEEAVALTAFDADGCGVVSVTLDGHEMRLLASLPLEHRSRRVRSGEILLVESVDGVRGRCVVTPLDMPPPA